jgi:predicted nucleic acid-binding Zn ribbon protein
MREWIIRLANTCWVCGTPISGGTVCSDCNKGPGAR